MNIFTDGSTLNNQCVEKRVGGMGVFFGDNDTRNISKRMKKNATNQRAELKACILALRKCKSEEVINIYTDSKYVIGCMTEWISNWIKNDWKKSDGKEIKNLDLIKKLYSLFSKKNITFYHVKAHQKKPSEPEKYNIWYGNMMADKLATDAAKSTQ
jgi:ribonuclease HI